MARTLEQLQKQYNSSAKNMGGHGGPRGRTMGRRVFGRSEGVWCMDFCKFIAL